jgi:SpoVK/Ycf46/Vps4 family AAA+-type ATPase
MKDKESTEQHSIDQMLKETYSQLQSKCLQGSLWDDMPQLASLARVLEIHPQELAILSVVYVHTLQCRYASESLLRALLQVHFKANKEKLPKTLRNLYVNGLLFRKSGEDFVHLYSLPETVQEAIEQNNPEGFSGNSPVGLHEALDYMRCKLMNNDYLMEAHIDNHLEKIFSKNADLNIIRYIESKLVFFNIESTFALLAICSRAVFENKSFSYAYIDNYVRGNRVNVHRLREEIHAGEWSPIADGYVEITGSNVMEFNPELQLTEKGFSFFLKELSPELLKQIRQRSSIGNTPLISPDEIGKQRLFFGDTLKKRTDRLAKLLKPAQFARYQKTYSPNARMRGLTLLFHGAPGCGKTEFALQLAKTSNRPIMKVQVTDFMSKWVGDSEANLKRLFSDYRRAINNKGQVPILLLNECDQIIGKRGQAGNAVDQMANSLQNLLLEEMETFNGILIGTTNLTENMDDAFERRWTIKLFFEKPDSAAMVKIWQSNIGGLTRKEAETLAGEYNLTPGEISNVARRFVVEGILGLEDTRLNTLLELCRTEKYQTADRSRSIGFISGQEHLGKAV